MGVMKLDFLAIGDTVIDNFIRLKDARVNCDMNDENCLLCVRFGDKVPFEFSVEVPAVGNAANAAVAASRLGLSTALRTYLGRDDHGARCLAALEKDRVDTSLIARQDGKLTNYHYVLWYESERTILIKHEQYDYEAPVLREPPAWVYLSSLGENSLPYHAELAKLFASWPETKIAFQPGTYQMKFGAAALRDIYARADLFFCNKEEAQKITGIETDDVKRLMDALRAKGPKNIVLTDGRKGAYALEEGGSRWFVPMYPDPRPPYERTGAGDAFASSVTAALALGLPLREALLWGPVNAMEVVQAIGAQKGLVTREQMEKFLKEAPADYRLSPLP